MYNSDVYGTPLITYKCKYLVRLTYLVEENHKNVLTVSLAPNARCLLLWPQNANGAAHLFGKQIVCKASMTSQSLLKDGPWGQ